MITPGAEKIGQVEGVALYFQPAMVPMYADAEITIDVIDEPMSDALSLETAYGLRFVVREPATRSGHPGTGTAGGRTTNCGLRPKPDT